MKILFLTHFYYPHIGGVEKHVYEVRKYLERKGNSVKVVSEADIKYPKMKFIGLIYIWIWLFRNRNIVQKADIVHVHDVFIWYLPFRFLYPYKKVIATIHGLEWDTPLSKASIWQKKLTFRLSAKTIGVGNFLEKYLGIKFDRIIYGASSTQRGRLLKNNNSFVYVGRLEKNTGLLKFLSWLKANQKSKVDFCGDGELRNQCEKYGKVHGFCDPIPFLKKAEYCVPGGYLAALEGLSYKCKLKLFWNNKVKEDYWKMSPFWKLKGNKLEKWAKEQTWEKLANEYLTLYNNIQ